MKNLMKLYYLLIFGFVMLMLVMWLPKLFIGLLIFTAAMALAALITWYFVRRKLKNMSGDLQAQMMKQMQQGMGADFLSQMMGQQMGKMPGQSPDPAKSADQPWPGSQSSFHRDNIYAPGKGPVIHIQPEELPKE